MIKGRMRAALKIAEAKRPKGEVAMTEIMLVSQALLDAANEIERLREALREIADLDMNPYEQGHVHIAKEALDE